MPSRVSIRKQFLLFCSFSLPLLASASTTDTPTACYVINGQHNADAGYRCDNSTTGHSTCCQAGAICFSNGVCQQANGNVQDYLRVGCTDPTWKDPACLNQCTTYARRSTAGIRFCNGAITSTTEYCCDTGAYGVGSFACCENDSDIFNISPVATVLAQIPFTYTSSSTSFTSSTSSTSTSSTSTSSISSTSTSSISTSITTSGSDMATTSTASQTSAAPLPSVTSASSRNAAAIGAGVAIPCAIIALAILGWLLWRRRRAQKAKSDQILKNNEAGFSAQGYPITEGAYNTQAQGGYSPSEIGTGYDRGYLGEAGGIGFADKKGYFAPLPTEMDTERTVHEMDGGHFGGR
ncbi:predicted protein [Sclerotinia sclerotiorum 1980 UF-70]|uniref:Mid2 domain-containing protein n=2 Tax=Sclerotinia sclerotiorum (strain ATCC 18683 / 1980 / Ss-1) TaxID=665079 RepID=A0A1D9Q3M7_SCLS1|nr:predicted protein [Sclerotinia sclerotiorum 1980 UF-70]APA09561.1 hypothetical protein sscle_05g043310 [Sclerotinia sclerotiorum 1980 UF-70]EDO03816.1 predicted protein [Sclerotinia sclerotiorum 1980 UF-70]